MKHEANPIVLLTAEIWHIVEHSREAYVAFCGQKIVDRRAHSRLNTIGQENLCPSCLALFSSLKQNAI